MYLSFKWLIKVFGVLSSRESLALTLSYFSHFPGFYIVCKLNIFWICKETLALMFECIFGFDIDRKFNFNH